MTPTDHPVPVLPDVDPAAWREANRRLLAKALGEWCFEDMLKATGTEDGGYRIDLNSGTTYAFHATPGAFGWLRVDPDSITRTATSMLGNAIAQPAWDALQFLMEAATTIDSDPSTLATYFTELSATLAVDAARLTHGGETVAELRALGHSELECRMTGHNLLVANKGRIGFSATDVRQYAPESARSLKLLWVAVHRGLAEFRGTSELSENGILSAELDEETRSRFTAVLERAGVDPRSYVWMPVHPWQWDHAVQTLHAADVAQRRIIPLGDSPDAYLPGQSIRTMANISAPDRHDVKLPLKILNTLVWRGIPPHCTMGAPVVTQWLRGLVERDAFLTDERRTVFLGEIASVTVRHPYLSTLDQAPYQHLEALGCIWRESVSARKDPDERVRTFASLLHVDGAGNAFVAELVRASGLDPQEWLRRLFDTLLVPIMHVLYRYGVTFNPHGQNTLIGYDADDVPVRLFLKDFVDDVCVSFTDVPERGPEPDGHDHVLPRKHPSIIKQHVVDQVFVGHFRYLAPLCAEQLGVPERTFWRLVRQTILDFQQQFRRSFPELAGRFAEYDLLTPEIPRYGLNRDRIVVTRYGDRALRHALFPNGTHPNPLAEG
ncbi:IucA/IucC family protein [Streptomyces roseicoloratus]|uniref:IucA/IucC family siderophore biosynthesis protein n=1 Tax=Streptomyces roseicoloratus TaxID=2508722 RepID=A0ABY9S1N2_9ACTN|nr:IucA/IucC family siderophore biosynthesis protein [Streptomyces roseicoloratus]WMX48339.1 IucA/IucC family siderophore biosynthesis protein [Streptomyces roseicoloratus]